MLPHGGWFSISGNTQHNRVPSAIYLPYSRNMGQMVHNYKFKGCTRVRMHGYKKGEGKGAG